MCIYKILKLKRINTCLCKLYTILSPTFLKHSLCINVYIETGENPYRSERTLKLSGYHCKYARHDAIGPFTTARCVGIGNSKFNQLNQKWGSLWQNGIHWSVILFQNDTDGHLTYYSSNLTRDLKANVYVSQFILSFSIFNMQDCFFPFICWLYGQRHVCSRNRKNTYSILVFPGLKLETISLSKLWKLADDWLCEWSPEIISYLVTVRPKSKICLETILIRLAVLHTRYIWDPSFK
jgi:hypothetical protein